MRRATFAVLVLVLAGASRAAAQTSQQPTIVLTIGGGVITGHGLWTIDKQPLCLLNQSTGSCSGLYDTLTLSRSISPSIVLGASGTYFPWPHLGIHAEISYVGFPNDDACTARFLNPDAPDERARQMCDNLSAASGRGSAISLFVGATLRAASRRAVSPYLRGNVGFVSFSGSTTEVVGAYIDGTGAHERQIIEDLSPGGIKPMLGLATGFTSPVGSGYQFRFELRDMMTAMERLTGPANDLAVAPSANRSFHHFALILGLDVVLEKKRGRRY